MKGCLLPIGVVMPTLNARPQLPAHLAQMWTWSDLVEEIVVVDSQSEDGTGEYLRMQLDHPCTRHFSQPRGLYQAWNYGVAQLQGKYTYISTAGDSITREGLEHLVETAERFNADVVVSPPRFVLEPGEQMPFERWPIQETIAQLGLASPALLPRPAAFFYAAYHAVEQGLRGLLGSSASNLYRTTTLQQRPFPTDCGHSGDAFWAVRNTLQVALAVTPRECSTFLVHPKTWNLGTDDFYTKLVWRALSEARQVLQEESLRAALTPDADQLQMIAAYLDALHCCHQAQVELDGFRAAALPWVLRPLAWQARRRRTAHRRRVADWRARLRAAVAASVQAKPQEAMVSAP